MDLIGVKISPTQNANLIGVKIPPSNPKKIGVNRILMDLIGVKIPPTPKKIKSVQKFHHQTKKIGVNRFKWI